MPTSMQKNPDGHVRQQPEIDLDSHISILEEYHQSNGHAHIYDVTCDEKVLASAKLLFYLSRSKKLNSVQIRRLSDIGFRYNRGRWRRHLLELVDFQSRFGHTRVPTKWKENKRLASFVRRLRRLRKRNKLPSSVIARFDEIGFVWNVREHSTGIPNLSFYRRAGYRAAWTDPATDKRTCTQFEIGEHLDAKNALRAAISERRRRLDQYICAVWNDPHISDASKDRRVKKYEEDIQSLDSGDIATMRGISWFERSGFRVEWTINGVPISRTFSSRKRGEERAKALALEYLESLRQVWSCSPSSLLGEADAGVARKDEYLERYLKAVTVLDRRTLERIRSARCNPQGVPPNQGRTTLRMV